MQRTKIFGLAAFALAAATIPSATGATLLDDFSLPGGVGTIVQILPSSNPTVVDTVLAGGTNRRATFAVTSNPVNQFDLMGGIGGGVVLVALSQITGAAGNVSLDYTFGSTLDLSANQLLEVVSASAGTAFSSDFTIITSTGNLVLNSSLPVAPAGTTNFWLSSFSGSGDLTQVTGFRAVFSGVASSLSVDSLSFTETPEPGTALLLALPVLAVIRRRKS